MNVLRRFIERIVSTKEKRVILENFASLSFLQAANYLLPLITLPYLVRVLGPEKFGLIAFAQAFAQYFLVVIDYGFIFSATREISMHRDDIKKISLIFSSVFFVKGLFLIASSFCFILLLIFIPKFGNDWLVYLYSFGVIIGQALFPTWFFQGMEKMKYVTFLNILGKLIFTVLIFIFIRKQEDYINVPLITSIGFILIGIISLFIIHKDFKVRFTRIQYKDIMYQLYSGWHTFISLVAVALYTNTNVFILGIFANNTMVGYYSAAEKILLAIQKIIGTISQSVFPYISKLAAISKKQAVSFVQKLVWMAGGSFFFISVIIFIFAESIVNLLLGPKYHDSIIILRIFAFLPFIVVVSNTFLVQGLYAMGHQKVASKYIATAAIIYLPIAVAATYYFHYIGTAVCFLIMEIAITILSRHHYLKIINEHDV